MSSSRGAGIAAHGEFWDPDLVQWGKRGRGHRGTMWGTVDGLNVDVWSQLGIYVLHHDWDPVYVGRVTALNRAIGARLREHRVDRLAGRWDRFSWYGLRGIKANGDLRKIPKHLNMSPERLVVTLEALLLGVTNPPLNRSETRLPDSKRVIQEGAETPRPMLARLQAIEGDLGTLSEKIDAL